MAMDEMISIAEIQALIDDNQWAALKRALCGYNAVDTAQLLGSMDDKHMLLAFRILPKDYSAAVFAYMDSDEQAHVVKSISNREIRALMEELYLDDAVDFLEEVPAGVVHRALLNTDEKTRALINVFMNYPEDSAGSIMTVEFVELKEDWTVGEAMEHIRRTAVDRETIYTCYVVDGTRKLVGIVALRRLILAGDDAKIGEIMNRNVISANTLDDQEQVADTVHKYGLIALPVVDNENRLVGIVTVDDVMDVIEEEDTEDFERMAAMLPSEAEYLKTSVWRLAKNRLPWLMVLMFAATFTGYIVRQYNALLQSAVVLMAFVPMLMDTAGNCGSQSSTLVIRGMALGEVRFSDLFRVLWKELKVALMVGTTLSAINFVRLVAIERVGVPVALVVSVTLFCTVMMAKLLGCTLPLLAQRVKIDPAVMAGPVITAIVDACSLAVYFPLARLALNLL
jgi:magnesium transporter